MGGARPVAKKFIPGGVTGHFSLRGDEPRVLWGKLPFGGEPLRGIWRAGPPKKNFAQGGPLRAGGPLKAALRERSPQ